MEFKVTSNLQKPNTQALQTYIFNNLKHLWYRCIGSFIDATLDQMSVDTGMSTASLMPLAIEIGWKQYIKSRMYSNRIRPGHTGLYGEFASNNDLPRSPASGMLLGRNAYDLDFGTKQSPQLTFSFHIVVFQHFLHENGIKGNWQSLEAGKEAFLRTWDEDFHYYIDAKKIKGYLLGKVSY